MTRSYTFIFTSILAIAAITFTATKLVERGNSTANLISPQSFDSTFQGSTKVGAMSGPWPECMGMECFNCLNFIRFYTDTDQGIETVKLEIIHPNQATTKDFRTDRVRIYCNENGYVRDVPSRG